MKLEGGRNENSRDYFASSTNGDVSRTTPFFLIVMSLMRVTARHPRELTR